MSEKITPMLIGAAAALILAGVFLFVMAANKSAEAAAWTAVGWLLVSWSFDLFK